MVFALLKSFLLPRKYGTRYTPLSHSPTTDVERCASMDSGICMSGEYSSSREKPDSDCSSDNSSDNSSNSWFPARVNTRIIADATIGLSDGLTVPFALTAGLSALGDSKVVIYGGFAELVAGGISMGLGGYLGAKSEAEAYQAALSETRTVARLGGRRAESMVKECFQGFGFAEESLDALVATLRQDPERMVEFLMRFHRRLAEADFASSRAYLAGLTISTGYFFGGLVPLVPYLFLAKIQDAFVGSVVVMALALFAFGWLKTSLVGEKNRWICLKNSAQMVVLGGVAAGAAMGCVKAIA